MGWDGAGGRSFLIFFLELGECETDLNLEPGSGLGLKLTV